MKQVLGIGLERHGDMIAPKLVLPAPMPVGEVMRGRDPEAVAQMMGRLFNLCGAAQSQAVRLSLGLPADDDDTRREILRDHMAKLFLFWPKALGHASPPMPEGWQRAQPALLRDLWGMGEIRDLDAWLVSEQGLSPLISAIDRLFAPHEAVARVADLFDPMLKMAQENSPAGRMAFHPLMKQAEETRGRGPLWRALGRLLDLTRIITRPAGPVLRPDNTALVAAARGTYALRGHLAGGVVETLERVTPTDHLLAPGGAMELSLATLPWRKAGLAALVVDILDPCIAVEIKGVPHA
ncbi:HupK protein [Thioclava sp. GXIMD2076]|uniref:HupK protein n=1 Tax=Thioclava sp. GXIMD2076 TaxID=3131931 RepID=UPI0030CBD926